MTPGRMQHTRPGVAVSTGKGEMFHYVSVTLSIGNNAIGTDPGQRGYITARHPSEVIKTHAVKFEREMLEKHGIRATRQGSMFAVWDFEDKPTLAQATASAASRRPDRIYVILSEAEWEHLTPFTLPPEVEFVFNGDQFDALKEAGRWSKS